jgi:hypothetical protein
MLWVHVDWGKVSDKGRPHHSSMLVWSHVCMAGASKAVLAGLARRVDHAGPCRK